jgi:hypothetical protein
VSGPPFPDWLHYISAASLLVGAACSLIIAIDEVRRPQEMMVMNIVWVVTALFGSVIWLLVYLRWGRPKPEGSAKPPMPIMVFKGSSHCGAGCMIGDVVAEWTAFWLPTIAVWFGWHRIFAEKTFAVWIPDFALAYLFGVIFQYFTIAPMRHLSVPKGILAALKADTASITAWQVGMYGLMAVLQFAWFKPTYGHIAKVDSFELWFAMQWAMLAGFATSFPVNWLLITIGWKEKM